MTIKSLPNITLKLCGQDWFGNIERLHYLTGGVPAAALDFVDSHGESIATLTVNLPGHVSGDVVAIKDYSENEGVFAQLIEQGIIESLNESIPSGFVRIPLARIIKKELLYDEQTELMSRRNDLSEFPEPHEHVGWPGDGTGEDDLADYNQNEADDYREE